MFERRKRPRWTVEELQYLIDNYEVMSYQEMADGLGRTLMSVTKKIQNERERSRKIKLKEATKLNEGVDE